MLEHFSESIFVSLVIILADDVKQIATLKSAELVTSLMVHDVVNSNCNDGTLLLLHDPFYVMNATVSLKINKYTIHIYEKQVLGFDFIF